MELISCELIFGSLPPSVGFVVSHLNLKLAPSKMLALAPVLLLEERAVLRADRPATSLWAEGRRRLQREVAAEADRPGRRLRPAVEGPLEADELPAGNVPRGHEFPEERDYDKLGSLVARITNPHLRFLFTRYSAGQKYGPRLTKLRELAPVFRSGQNAGSLNVVHVLALKARTVHCTVLCSLPSFNSARQ